MDRQKKNGHGAYFISGEKTPETLIIRIQYLFTCILYGRENRFKFGIKIVFDHC